MSEIIYILAARLAMINNGRYRIDNANIDETPWLKGRLSFILNKIVLHKLNRIASLWFF